MTKDNGGWTPLVFAYRSGSRSVFLAAVDAFLERGEEGSRRVSGYPIGSVTSEDYVLRERRELVSFPSLRKPGGPLREDVL